MSQNEIITKEFKVVRASTATEKANSLEGNHSTKKRRLLKKLIDLESVRSA
jgi:hypothetical protein